MHLFSINFLAKSYPGTVKQRHTFFCKDFPFSRRPTTGISFIPKESSAGGEVFTEILSFLLGLRIRITLMRIRIALMRIRILILIKVMRICYFWSIGPPEICFEPLKLLNFDLNADSSPAFHSNADQDLASHQIHENLRPLIKRPFRALFRASKASQFRLLMRIRIQLFTRADPDPASKN
jgi:hypothetical protein